MSAGEAPGGDRVRVGALAAVLALCVAARFVRLDADPAWGIVSTSGEFLTDEGWYTKSAQLRTRFGTWTTEHDTVWFTHNALFSLIHALAFQVFGVGVVTARLVSALAFCATLGGLYLAVRPWTDRVVALAACVAAAVALPCVTYSRMALAEPAATAFSVLAVAAWTRLPRGPAAAAAGLLLASAAYFVKVSFLFTIAALVLLALGDAVVLARAKSWVRAALTAVLAAGIPAVTWLVQQKVSAMDAVQAETFGKWHVQSRLDELAPASVLVNEAKIVYHLLGVTGCTVLVAAVLLAAVLRGAFAAEGRQKLRPPFPRGAVALTLWLVGGISFFGLFSYQPARYLYFAAFPLAALAMAAVASLAPARRHAAALCLLGLHAGLQLPGTIRWLSREDLTSADRVAREVVSRMNLSEGPVGLVGGTASFISLYDDRILPLDFREDWLAERVERWRPRYLITSPSRANELPAGCPGLVAGIEPVAKWRIMENYYTDEEHALYLIVYAR